MSSLVKVGATSVQPPSPASGSRLFGGRRGQDLALDAVTEAVAALVQVLGRRVAEHQRNLAAVRRQLLQPLAERDAHAVIVGAEIGRAQALIRRQQVGVDRHDGDLLRLDVGRLLGEQLGHRRSVRRRDGDAGDVVAGDQVGDDLDFAGFVGGERRTGIEALIFRVRVGGVPVGAALAHHREEAVVEALHDDGERLLLRHCLSGAERQRGSGNHQQCFPHLNYLPCFNLSSLGPFPRPLPIQPGYQTLRGSLAERT